MLQQCFNFKLRFYFYLHRWWWFFRSSSRLMRLQLGDVEDIMNTLESSPKFQLVRGLAKSSKDLEGTHESLTKFALTGQVKVLRAQ